jgi:hypothetical protein
MKTCLATLATVGLASAAGAQGSPGSWEFAIDNPLLTPTDPSAQITLSIEPPVGDYAIAGVGWDVHADMGDWSDQTMLIAHPGQTPGAISGSSVTGIVAGQLALFGFSPEPGRIEVWRATFSVTDFTFREINFSTETNRFVVYPTEAGLPASEPRDLPTEGRAAIRVIPTPAGLALLGLGALAAARRRR